MLKLLKPQSVLSKSIPNSHFQPSHFRFLQSFKELSNKNERFLKSARFCSGSGDESKISEEVKAVEESENGPKEGGESGNDSKSNSAIVSANTRLEDQLTVLALPLLHRPLFPGFYMPIYVKDKNLLATLVEKRERSVPYAGAFLVKDEAGTDSSLTSGSEKEINIHDLKGKKLLDRLYDIGTLAQITSIQGDKVVLLGHRRLRITEMAEENPLAVKVDHLKDMPFDKDDDVIKATSFEVISTMKDVLRASSLWKDHVQTYIQHVGDFNHPRIADFGAAVSGTAKLLAQKVLEELDAYSVNHTTFRCTSA